MSTPRNLTRTIAITICAAALLALPAAAQATPISYTFDGNNQGWDVSQDGASSGTDAPWTASAGNPGGGLQQADTGAESGCPANPCDLLWFYSPPVPGSLSPNYGGTFSFDLSISVAPAFQVLFTIQDTSGNVVRHFTDSVGPGYRHYSQPLTEADWEYCPSGDPCAAATQAQFQSVLASPRYHDIRVDAVDGIGEQYRLDNVTLTEPPPPPAPAPPAPAQKKKCKKKKSKKRGAAAAKKKCKKKSKKRSAHVS